MKKILKGLLEILLIPYLVIVIFLTTCLLNYNDFKVTVFGDKTLIIVKDDSLEPSFVKGDLLVVTKNNNKKINVNDDIFFYDALSGSSTINLGRVLSKEEVSPSESTFKMAGDYSVSSEYVIGKTKSTVIYHKLGKTLGFLESKWGFLFVVIFPILIAFLYEIYAIFKEVNSEVKKTNKR